jgi:uncharacterized membrane protein YfcA
MLWSLEENMRKLTISLFNWLNDSSGSSYGDERERLRYYESNSALLNLQFLLSPTVAGILILAFSKSAALPIAIMALFPIALSFLALIYLRGEKVALVKNAEKNPKWMMLSVIAFLPLEIALMYKFDDNHGNQVTFWIGVISAMLLLFVALGFFPQKKKAK